MVRTPGFHPGNPGSIPGEITKVKHPSNDGCFTLVLLKTVVLLTYAC